MRSIATINLEVGMLSLPMSISTFADYNGIALSNVCPHGHDIHMKRWCEDCQKEIPFNELKSAFKISKDQKIVFGKELIEVLKEKQDKSSKVLKVFRQQNTSNIKYLVDKVYYLTPKEKFEKGYFILLSALQNSGNTLLIDFAIRNRKHIGLIEPFGQYLIIFQLLYADQIRQPTALKPIAVSESDTKNAQYLLESILEETKNVNIAEIKDTYKDELFEAITSGKTDVPKIEKKEEDSFSRGLEVFAKSKVKAK